MLKLHLGCGTKRMEGYVNIDIRPGDAVDVVSDLRELSFEKESVDLIYSCCAIEHFSRKEWFDLLKKWTSFLKPGGKLYLSTNDFDAITSWYQKSRNLEQLLGLLIGGQKTLMITMGWCLIIPL